MQKNTLLMAVAILVCVQLKAQTDTLALFFPTMQIAADEQVCVDVKVANFNDVAAMQFALNWNAEALSLENVNIPFSSEVPFLSSRNFGMIDREAGILRFSWLDESLQSVSLTDSTTLFELCYIGKTPNTESPLILAPEVLPTEVLRVDLQNIPVSFVPGNITVGDRNLIVQETGLFIESMTVPAQSTGCVSVRVNGFEHIDSISFNLTWDPELLQPEDRSIFNDGVLEVTIGSSTTEGVTLIDDDILHQTCFTAIGDAGDFSEVTIEDVTISSTVADIVNTTVRNGTVEIGVPLLLPVPVDIFIVDKHVEPGATFCVDVMANNFNNVVVMQHALLWDNNVLTYEGVRAGENLEASELNTIPRAFGRNGELIIVWRDYDAAGTSVPIGMPVYQVCFKANENINADLSTEIRFGQQKPYPTTLLQRFGGVLYQISQVYGTGTISVSSQYQQGNLALTSKQTTGLVYPNPASDLLYINPEVEEIESIQIFDLMGRMVKQVQATNQIDVSFLETGQYFIQIKTHRKLVNETIQIIR